MQEVPTHIKPPKASAGDFYGRFREIVSDPLNLMIERHPLAGHAVEDGTVILHNGIRVPFTGPTAYYGAFSYILMINRGVHEPLEEYVFQEVMKVMPQAPTMLELGAYWAHYSMWLKKLRPQATTYMVEPDAGNIEIGKANFARNSFTGHFEQAFVGHGHFGVDAYLQAKGIERLDILHSDIQSFEVEMLKDCAQTLGRHAIDYIFVSTHTQELHAEVVQLLGQYGYRVEVSSDFEFETTSYDGFIFASSPLKERIFKSFQPMSRLDIARSTPRDVVQFLQDAG